MSQFSSCFPNWAEHKNSSWFLSHEHGTDTHSFSICAVPSTSSPIYRGPSSSGETVDDDEGEKPNNGEARTEEILADSTGHLAGSPDYVDERLLAQLDLLPPEEREQKRLQANQYKLEGNALYAEGKTQGRRNTVLRIQPESGSKPLVRIWDVYPGSEFFQSRIRIKEFTVSILTQKIVS